MTGKFPFNEYAGNTRLIQATTKFQSTDKINPLIHTPLFWRICISPKNEMKLKISLNY